MAVCVWTLLHGQECTKKIPTVLRFKGKEHDKSSDCPGQAGVKGDDGANRLVGKAPPPQVACAAEDLKCGGAWHTLLSAGTKPRTSHHRSPGGRGIKRGSAQESFLKGRAKAVISQTTIETVSKATPGNF